MALGERDREHVVLGEELAHVLREDAVAVDRGRAGRHALVGEHAHGLAQEDLLLRESH